MATASEDTTFHDESRFTCVPLGRRREPERRPSKEPAMTRFPDHPGTVLVEDLFRKTSQVTPVAEIPESRRFLYLKNGVATHDPAEATERVPIVEVHVLSVDANGNLAPAEQAHTVRIKEFGPGRRPLRSMTLHRE
jgi:hypothetical protein